MKLIWKFNLILLLVFGLGLGIAGWVSYRFLQSNAQEQVGQQARLMMETAQSARQYTIKQIRPLLQSHPSRFTTFLPQTVPAYSATESFNYLRAKYSDYTYKEATLNPTNLRDRATDWETDVVNLFRNDTKRKEVVGERDTPTGRSMYLARPISADPPCLACHDQPKGAPAAMIKAYGTANGFGWKEGEIVGAQIVSVPMALPFHLADEAWRQLMLSLGGVFLFTLIILDLVLFAVVVSPIRRMSAMADEISLGNLQNLPEFPVKGKDEISVLAGSFNRLRRSLVKAMNMLEQE